MNHKKIILKSIALLEGGGAMGRVTWLKIFRERAGFNQGDFAETVGISKSRYVRLERMLAPLKIDEVVKISKALNLQPSKFAKLPRGGREERASKGSTGVRIYGYRHLKRPKRDVVAISHDSSGSKCLQRRVEGLGAVSEGVLEGYDEG